ncbi:nhaA [Symbiodinium natans]|uniref:NhaA protein n=1 Tax=Symbiodinium natans TaxID=878477 RepID=A0A812JMQ7_9DINO|nr:nhaA [Symbiodinium natans]
MPVQAIRGLPDSEHEAAFAAASVEVGGNRRWRQRKPSICSKELALHSLGGASQRTSSKEVMAKTSTRADILIKTGCVESDSEGEDSPTSQPKEPPGNCKAKWDYIIGVLQKYSVPLVLGVLLALLWCNVDEQSYKQMIHWMPISGFTINGYNVDLHFVVNDVFMCFFFGLAIKEVTEALLPGGSLSPISRALNPLLATFGGVVGPALFYLLFATTFHAAGVLDDPMCLPDDYHENHEHGEHRRLAGDGGSPPASAYTAKCSLEAVFKGWGIPTATDISLAWMFALLIFGPGHAAINFLLLLAILDDALGMIIIAAFYPDPDAPVEPIWLLLVLGAMLVAFVLRKAMVSRWQFYIVLAAPLSWIGLFKAHVHPALSLVFVVPFMPATHAIEARGPHELGRVSHSPTEQDDDSVRKRSSMASVASMRSSVSLSLRDAYVVASKSLKNIFGREEMAPLHVFEHTLKIPVDFGMFFFGLANAGVKLDSIGGVTACVGLALLVGKTVGIVSMSVLGSCIGAPLPKGLGMADLVATAALGGVGLTVALFVANEAFVQPEMQGQAKMGAVLSTGCGAIAWLTKVVFTGRSVSTPEHDEGVTEDSSKIDRDVEVLFCKSAELRRMSTDNSQSSNVPETSCNETDVCLASATSSRSLPDMLDELPTCQVSGQGEGMLA